VSVPRMCPGAVHLFGRKSGWADQVRRVP
jgi:hypothetical protein